MFDIEISGLADFDRLLKRLGAGTIVAARQSINEATRYGRTLGSAEIRKQVRLKKSYVEGRSGNNAARLAVTKQARDTDLEGVITARDRPTSLARFRVGQFLPRTRGSRRRAVRVQVKASGGVQTMPNAFYIRLRRGSAAVTDDNFNEGIAVRLKPGERIPNKRLMSSMGGGLYVLYGPSVGQVYRSVAPRSADAVADQLANRFVHNMQRFFRG